MSTRPLVTAEPRKVVGKSVNTLRRQGLLPAVVYGHGKASQPIQLDARAFEIRRVPRVGQLVEDDRVVTTRDDALHEVRADEAGAAGDEHAHPQKGS